MSGRRELRGVAGRPLEDVRTDDDVSVEAVPTRGSSAMARVGRCRGVAALAAVALVGAVGCGGDDSGAADRSAVTEPSSAGQDLADGADPADEAEVADGDAPGAAAGDDGVADVLEGRDAWVRMPATGQSVAAAYLTFVNHGDTDVRVADVSSPLAVAELHETVADDDGVMRMEHRPDGFVVPAGDELVFEPGGAHVMLLDVDPLDLRLSDETELTFTIDAGELVVLAEIRNELNDPGERGDDGAHEESAPADRDAGSDGATHHDPTLGIDPDALHALDDELHAGTYEPDRQRDIVADALAALEHTDAPADALADVRDVLLALDAALTEGDVSAAAADHAFRAHDRGHSLVPHDDDATAEDHAHDDH